LQLSTSLAPDAASRTLLHTVARLHYEADLSQIEIARRLSLSAATISRLLRRARDEGIVHIEVRSPVEPEALGRELARCLGLRRAAVVEGGEQGVLAALAGPVGAMLQGADLLPGSVVAIGWGRAVRAVIEAGLPRIPGAVVVAANGGLQQAAPHFQINEFVRLAAEQMGGNPHFIHAPFLPGAASRQAFLEDPMIRDHVALWDRIDVAILGIGLAHAADPGHGRLAVTQDEHALVHAAGDVIRHYYDASGVLIPWEGESQLIAISPAQLRSVPLAIGVAVSIAKAPAILGAVRAGLVNALVTDARTAQAVLDLAQSQLDARA